MGIKEWLQKFVEDKEFAAKYYEIHSIGAVLAEAKKDGYSITEEEFSEMLKAVSNREITDAEAEAAAGGYDAGLQEMIRERINWTMWDVSFSQKYYTQYDDVNAARMKSDVEWIIKLQKLMISDWKE